MAPDEQGRLRTLIVDDERLARESLQGLLAAHKEIIIVGQASSVREAEKMVESTRPDLIFLDIQMPGGSGFDLLERLVAAPAVVFVTAFDQYAIRAFEVNALDYLLKPVEPERLARAIERVGKREALPQAAGGALRRTDRVFLNTGRQAVFLPVTDIAAVRAEGNYTDVVSLNGQTYLVRVSVSQWEERLPRDLFVLLDRSLLINRDQIRRCDLQERRAELYLGNVSQPFLLGRAAVRRFKETSRVSRTPVP
jgi:two-component system LytT family response regulator